MRMTICLLLGDKNEFFCTSWIPIPHHLFRVPILLDVCVYGKTLRYREERFSMPKLRSQKSCEIRRWSKHVSRTPFSIEKQTDDVFVVAVTDGITTTHTVTVTDQSLNDLTDNSVTKTQLLEFSFKFLLEREPNTSILSSFDINVISKYFSDYRDEVKRWCNESQN